MAATCSGIHVSCVDIAPPYGVVALLGIGGLCVSTAEHRVNIAALGMVNGDDDDGADLCGATSSG